MLDFMGFRRIVERRSRVDEHAQRDTAKHLHPPLLHMFRCKAAQPRFSKKNVVA